MVGVPVSLAGRVASLLSLLVTWQAAAWLVHSRLFPGAGAVLGTSVDVPTLEGQVSVKVPAGTQPDSILRLRGKGLPRFGGGARGDIYVRLQVHVPERLSNRQRQLFEQLRPKGS